MWEDYEIEPYQLPIIPRPEPSMYPILLVGDESRRITPSFFSSTLLTNDDSRLRSISSAREPRDLVELDDEPELFNTHQCRSVHGGVTPLFILLRFFFFSFFFVHGLERIAHPFIWFFFPTTMPLAKLVPPSLPFPPPLLLGSPRRCQEIFASF